MVRKLIWGMCLVSLFVGLVSSGNVMAQGDLKLETVIIDLWPEYDQPAMLVIYHIKIDPAVALPVKLSIQIPARVGEPFAVAARQADGNLINMEYSRQATGDLAAITLQTSSSEIQIEYYDPALSRIGKLRKFTYTWMGDYRVDNLIVQVQQPGGADQMNVVPQASSVEFGSDGLQYHTVNLGALVAGQRLPVSLEYSKDTDTLTASGQSVDPAAPLSQLSTGLRLTTILPWLLGVLGLVLIAGGGYWYWRTGLRSTQVAPRRNRHKPATSPANTQESQPIAPELSDQTVSPAIYCHECGNRAMPGDRFCRVCGMQLRLD